MSDVPSTTQLVVFAVGGEEYALPIAQVHEIIRYSPPRSVASDIPSVRGVISLRGQVIAVYDLAQRLGLQSTIGEQTKVVVVDTGSGTAGLIVDEVNEVLTVERAGLLDVPAGDSTLIDSVARIDDRLVILLDPAAIVASRERAAA